jgi:alanine racemase
MTAPAPAAALAGAILTVDLDAVAENYRRLKARLGGAECAAVVKADGYGLGAVPVARRLVRADAGCRRFFVARFAEAAALKPHVPDATVYVLDGLLPGAAADYAAADVVPVLNDRGQVEEWARWCRAQGRRPAAVQFDTGMTRLGLDAGEAEAGGPALAACADMLVMSHLVSSEIPDDPLNARQLAAFTAIRARLPAGRASLANSSGLFLPAAFHFDLGRPGYALYGGNPTPGRPNPMAPVVTLETRILQVRDVGDNRTVGYNATARVGPGTCIATVAVGYADGYLRSLSSRGRMRLAGRDVPVIGRVSMDLVTLDVTAVPPEAARPGALVEAIGPALTVDDVADAGGTNGYEILTSLGPRYRRVYRGGEA